MTRASRICEGSNRPFIMLPVGLAHKLDGNLVAAAMLAQMAYLTSISSDGGWFDIPMNGKPPEGARSLYDRCGSWRYMLGAGDRALRNARNVLIKLGLLSERLVGVPARLRYKVNLERYRDFLGEETAQRYADGDVGAEGGSNEEDLPAPHGELATRVREPSKTGAADREVDSQNLVDDRSSVAVASVLDLQEWSALNGTFRETIPKRFPRDVPNPPVSAREEGARPCLNTAVTASHAELIALVAGEARCSAQALADALHDRLADKRNAPLANVEAWLRSIGARLARGERLSWGEAAGHERRRREALAKEVDDQLMDRRREKSPRKLADPTHVGRCLDAMPWAQRRCPGKLRNSVSE